MRGLCYRKFELIPRCDKHTTNPLSACSLSRASSNHGLVELVLLLWVVFLGNQEWHRNGMFGMSFCSGVLVRLRVLRPCNVHSRNSSDSWCLGGKYPIRCGVFATATCVNVAMVTPLDAAGTLPLNRTGRDHGSVFSQHLISVESDTSIIIGCSR